MAAISSKTKLAGFFWNITYPYVSTAYHEIQHNHYIKYGIIQSSFSFAKYQCYVCSTTQLRVSVSKSSFLLFYLPISVPQMPELYILYKIDLSN